MPAEGTERLEADQVRAASRHDRQRSKEPDFDWIHSRIRNSLMIIFSPENSLIASFSQPLMLLFCSSILLPEL